MINKLSIVFIGLVAGYFIQAYPQKTSFEKKLKCLIFTGLLPYIVITEIASHNIIAEWYYFIFGALFILVLYYLGGLIGFDNHNSALLATAEGGTLGFVLYLIINTEPISHFFLIDMLGNGGMLFSFIYYKLSLKPDLKGSFVKNPLMISLAVGIICSFLKVNWLELVRPLQTVQPYLLMILTFLICLFVGMQMNIRIAGDIIFSKEYYIFWLVRIIGAAASYLLGAPLALTILFILPPSFLLPVVYPMEDREHREYCTSFIAATIPVFVILSAIMIYVYRG